MAQLKYGSAKSGNVITVKISGSLDAQTAPLLEKKLQDEIAKEPDIIIVSMAGLEYIASAGMGTLINCNEVLSKKKKDLRLCELSPKVEKIITMLGFANFFSIYKTVQDAENA